jgi:hypothetical protein
MADPTQLGRKKAQTVRTKLDAWSTVRGAVQVFATGRIGDLSPRSQCFLLLGDPKRLDPNTGLSELGLWNPPYGWEDLVLASRGRILGWSSTHNRMSVFAARLLDPGQGAVPPFPVSVDVEGDVLSQELQSELLRQDSPGGATP